MSSQKPGTPVSSQPTTRSATTTPPAQTTTTTATAAAPAAANNNNSNINSTNNSFSSSQPQQSQPNAAQQDSGDRTAAINIIAKFIAKHPKRGPLTCVLDRCTTQDLQLITGDPLKLQEKILEIEEYLQRHPEAGSPTPQQLQQEQQQQMHTILAAASATMDRTATTASQGQRTATPTSPPNGQVTDRGAAFDGPIAPRTATNTRGSGQLMGRGRGATGRGVGPGNAPTDNDAGNNNNNNNNNNAGAAGTYQQALTQRPDKPRFEVELPFYVRKRLDPTVKDVKWYNLTNKSSETGGDHTAWKENMPIKNVAHLFNVLGKSRRSVIFKASFVYVHRTGCITWILLWPSTGVEAPFKTKFDFYNGAAITRGDVAAEHQKAVFAERPAEEPRQHFVCPLSNDLLKDDTIRTYKQKEGLMWATAVATRTLPKDCVACSLNVLEAQSANEHLSWPADISSKTIYETCLRLSASAMVYLTPWGFASVFGKSDKVQKELADQKASIRHAKQKDGSSNKTNGNGNKTSAAAASTTTSAQGPLQKSLVFQVERKDGASINIDEVNIVIKILDINVRKPKQQKHIYIALVDWKKLNSDELLKEMEDEIGGAWIVTLTAQGKNRGEAAVVED